MDEYCKNGHKRTKENTKYRKQRGRYCAVCASEAGQRAANKRWAKKEDKDKSSQFTDGDGRVGIGFPFLQRGKSPQRQKELEWVLPRELAPDDNAATPFYSDNYLLDEETDEAARVPCIHRKVLLAEWESEPDWMADVTETDKFPLFSIEAINKECERQRALRLEELEHQKWLTMVKTPSLSYEPVLDVIGYPYRFRRGLLKDIGGYASIANAVGSTETEVRLLFDKHMYDNKIAIRLWQLIFREDRFSEHVQLILWTMPMRRRLRGVIQKHRIRSWDVAYKVGVLPCLIRALLVDRNEIFLPIKVYRELDGYYRIGGATNV